MGSGDMPVVSRVRATSLGPPTSNSIGSVTEETAIDGLLAYCAVMCHARGNHGEESSIYARPDNLDGEHWPYGIEARQVLTESAGSRCEERRQRRCPRLSSDWQQTA
jgi:hypothetical protein